MTTIMAMCCYAASVMLATVTGSTVGYIVWLIAAPFSLGLYFFGIKEHTRQLYDETGDRAPIYPFFLGGAAGGAILFGHAWQTLSEFSAVASACAILATVASLLLMKTRPLISRA